MTTAPPAGAPPVIVVPDGDATRRTVILAVALGVVLVFGGPARVSGPSYHFVRQFGGNYLWGIGFVVVGALMMFAARWRPALLDWAFRVAAFGYVLFAVAGFGSAFAEPMAGLTGIVTYLWVAWLHISEAESLRAKRRLVTRS